MDGDEALVLLVSSVVAIVYWGSWYLRLIRLDTLTGTRAVRLFFPLLHSLCFLLLLIVLTTSAANEVRGSVAYIALFMATGAVGLVAINVLSTLIGISALQDGIERHNPTAAGAVGGAWLGATLCISGANVGEGTTIYTTLGPLGLSVGTLGGCWLVFAGTTNSTASIVVDRDRASAIRLAGLLIAWGLILGRAVAGDWVSTADTLRDFARIGWPVFVLLIFAIMVERKVQPGRRRPSPQVLPAGILPAVVYLIVASAWLVGVQ